MVELTPQEINEILDEYFSETFQRTYVGKRYVPIFGRKGENTMEWDNEAPYEPLTIVLYEGNSYTSRQYVPIGAEITDTDFWVLTGNYNAQVEEYRQEVETYTQTYGDAIDALEDALPIASFSSSDTVADELSSLDSRVDNIEDSLPISDFSSNNTVKSNINKNKNDIAYCYHTDAVIAVFSDSTFQTNPDPVTGIQQKSIVSFIEELSDATINNYGVGGYSSADILNQLNGMSSTALENETHIILACGTNDWQSSKTPVNIVNNYADGSFENNYRKIILKLLSMAPQAQIICVTPAYISSDQASSVQNLNRTGNDFKVYCDVINQVACDYNIPTLRLDNILGINEYNYQTKMVRSGGATGTIWVHYAESTNKKIAKMILESLDSLNVTYPSGECIDVTPYIWSMNNSYVRIAEYYGLGDLQSMYIEANTPLDLATPVLQENSKYYLMTIGGPYKIYTSADSYTNPISDIELQGFNMVEIIGGGSAITIRILSTNAVYAGIPKLVKFRPNIFNAFDFKKNLPIPLNTRKSLSVGSGVTCQCFKLGNANYGINVCKLTGSGLSISPITGAVTPLGDININVYNIYLAQGLAFGLYQDATGYHKFNGRVSGGKLYLNDSDGSTGTITMLEIYCVGI